MKKIKLVYWQEPNFGDALSPWLIAEISGRKIEAKGYNIRTKWQISRAVSTMLGRLPLSAWKGNLFPWETNVVGIGSIINRGNSCSLIWGAGYMLEDNIKALYRKVFAVRGKETYRRLCREGYKGIEPKYGDPALLLPLIRPAVSSKQTPIGVIPHWKETEKFISKYAKDFKVIDFRTKDIEKTLDEITSCEFILSTSLHGIIVAHAYGIPAIWIQDGYIDTDGFKFKDYWSSVGISYYDGFRNIDEILSDYPTFFERNEDISLPHIPISTIQRDLLQSFPYPLVQKYREILSLL